MNNDIVNNILLSKYHKVYVIDIACDEVLIYQFSNNNWVIDQKTTYTEYLGNLNKTLSSNDFNNLSSLLSISKIEEAINNGKNNIQYIINNDTLSYVLNISLLKEDNKKRIMIYSEQLTGNIKEEKNTKESDNNIVIENISDYIFKIFNTVNTNTDSDEVKHTYNYINTLINELLNKYPGLKTSFTNSAIDSSCFNKETILVIDDDGITCSILKKIFEDKYNVIILHNGQEAIKVLDSNLNHDMYKSKDNIVAIFLDLMMPVMDGFGVLDYLQKNNYLGKLPIAIISGDYSKETREKVYNYPIADMLEKPFNAEIIRHRITNLIDLYKSSNSLNELIKSQYKDLKYVIDNITSAYIIDYQDNNNRLSKVLSILCNQVKIDYPEYNLDDNSINKIINASIYYDIGNISIPRNILTKDNLNQEELNIIHNYPYISYNIIKYNLKNNDDHILIKYASNIAKYYHERYDGNGYPDKLKEEAIPLEAALVAIAVDFINLTKQYNKDYSKVHNNIINNSNYKYNPKLVESYKKVITELEKI